MAIKRASAPAARQVNALLHALGLLADRLAPARRPQDTNEPECSAAELRMLGAVGRNGAVAMTDLAASLRVPLSTATRTVDKLIAKGLVTRGGVKEDRRVVRIGFSARGKEINRYVAAKQRAGARKMLAELSASDRETLLALLAGLLSQPERE